MNKITISIVVCLLLVGCNTKTSISFSENLYPELSERTASGENISYYIDPNIGNDANSGTNKKEAWKTFTQVNQLILTRGNKIEILSPGTFRESLSLIGQGIAESPIIVHFAPGVYDFYPQNFLKRKFQISNTNDAPDSLKAVALHFSDCKNIIVNGNGAEIVLRGKAINTVIENCENISFDRIGFDYKRPTVSEIRVMNVNDHFADVEIHKDSKYEIIDSTLIWIGEGWQHKVQNYWQEFDRNSQKVVRKSMAVNNMKFSEIEKNRVRILFDKNPGIVEGLTYQNRKTFRDYSAVFMQKSKNISWNNTNVYFMHGMGFVSQFCENITIDSLIVKPKENSGRTCSAWADILHFSACKGDILITNSLLSATHDDPINVHGTHLRIVDVISGTKIKVRFMHPQTYGFDAFFVGDSIEFINSKSLLPYSMNEISQVIRINDKEFELTLNHAIPENIRPNDVIENSTWTPDVTIRNIKLEYTPTRGILVTTKGKVVIENSVFSNTSMSAILIADDASSWYESGYVRNVTIRNNKFIDCKTPVINIHPENTEYIEGAFVHKNIQITDNEFQMISGDVLSVKSTEGIHFSNNSIKDSKGIKINDKLRFKACQKIEIKDNKIINKNIRN